VVFRPDGTPGPRALTATSGVTSPIPHRGTAGAKTCYTRRSEWEEKPFPSFTRFSLMPFSRPTSGINDEPGQPFTPFRDCRFPRMNAIVSKDLNGIVTQLEQVGPSESSATNRRGK